MGRKTYEERLNETSNPLLKKLLRIIIEKKSNLCVAANFKTLDETLNFIDKVGKHICILKTQSERFPGDPAENLRLLYQKKKEYNFLLFEDRKFYDGMETIQSIYAEKYVHYADIVTVIPICGDGVFQAIENAAKSANLPEDEPRGCLAVCQVSFAGFIQVDEQECLKVAERNSSICIGIIAQTLQVSDDCSMIKATPGVHISKSNDGKNQQWNHPSQVIGAGADIVIVGRGIVSAPDNELEATTRLYKEISFMAYCLQVSESRVS